MIAINIDGKIKTFASIPQKWNKIHYYHTLEAQIHYEDGFREVVFPELLEGQKRGQLIFDSVNDVFTYEVIDKTAEELEAEKLAKQEQEKEKIKQEKLEKLAEEALTPEERLQWYKEWVAGSYAIGDRVIFKGKTFENTVANNTNAPDKGGWIEIK